jgi:tetratricopeptide (TPR) repeat protein
MMDQARKHLEAAEWPEAETALRDELENNPENAEAAFMLAQVRQHQGDLDDALKWMRDAERLEPFNPNIAHALGVVHIARQEHENAGRAFRQALDIDPGHVASRNGLAFIELAAGRFEAAEHAVDQVLSDEPENAQALTYKGTAVLERGAPEEAMVYLQEALRLEPEALTAQAQLGRAFLAAGNAAFAAQCFENALQKAPGSADLLEYLGRARLDQGEVAGALEALRSSVEQGRANPELFGALAACETAVGNPGQAEALLGAALNMQAESDKPATATVLPLAELRMARGAIESALELLQGLAASGVDNELLDILLSRALWMSGDSAGAIAAIQPRCNREGASSDARLAYVQALEADERDELAGEILDELLVEDPPALDVLFYRARKWFDAGEPQAIDALQDLVNQPRLGTHRLFQARTLLATALHRAGRFPEAAGQFAALAHRDAEVLGVDADFDGSSVDATTAFDPEVTASWLKDLPENEPPAPIFVIGWPGSGQERILPALAAHSGLRMVMDPSASQATRRAHIDRPRGAEALGSLDETQARLRRDRYWKALADQGIEAGDQRILDVMWLTVEALPTIARLFPGATVLVISRDPGDMSVAWLMGGYRNLEHMARVYGNQLALLGAARDALPLNFIDIAYDAVEDDPAGALGKVLHGLGLGTEPGVLERFEAVPLPVPIERGVHRSYAGSAEDEGAPGSGAVH